MKTVSDELLNTYLTQTSIYLVKKDKGNLELNTPVLIAIFAELIEFRQRSANVAIGSAAGRVASGTTIPLGARTANSGQQAED